MRIVVTGAAGFIGHHLARRLLDDGHDVVGIECFLAASYDPLVKRAAVAPLIGDPRFSLCERDLRSEALDDVLDGADALVHLAAMPGLQSGRDGLSTSCNLTATARLAAAARRAGVPRIVHASTSSVYGRVADGDEDQPTAPISAYGRSKRGAEVVMLGAGAVVLRYFSVYGPGQRPDMAYHGFCEAILDNRILTIHGDGQQERANTYIDDVVDATAAALGRGVAGEAYNIGGAEPIRLLDAVAILGQSLHRAPILAHRPARMGDQRSTRADTSKAHRDLGWWPSTPPTVGLPAQVRWHLIRRGAVIAA
jgi:nucleoside-diphosphate-sugar epimerase